MKKKYLSFYEKYKSINKKELINLTARKCKIKKDHVKAVVVLFLQQMEDDLFKTKSVSINNFIEFNLRRMPAKRGRNYYTGEIVPTKPFNIMKISLDGKLNKKLMDYCDPATYYASEQEKVEKIEKDPKKDS